MSTIRSFLLNHFKVNDLNEIKPFGNLTVHCWEFARDVTMNVTLGPNCGSLIMEEKLPRKPYNDLPVQFDNVSIRNIAIRYARNSDTQNGCFVRLNYYPKMLAKELEQQDKMIAAAGGVPGTFMIIPPRFNGPVNEFALRSSNENFYTNEAFIKTMAYLNPENVLNGIIKLTPEQSVDFDKTYQICDESGEFITQEAEHYFLIPAEHVFSWKLRVFLIWQQKAGLFSKYINVSPKDDAGKPYLLYHAVPDDTFNRIYKSFVTFWCGKVDMRPLKSIGLEFVGTNEAEVDATITYTCFPANVPENQLIPSLPDNFIPYEQIIRREK